MPLKKFCTLYIFCFSALLLSCKKNNDTIFSKLTSDQLKDSVMLYARDLYLWYNQLPSSFSATGYDDPNKIMEGIRQYSTETGFSAPVDKWSFAVKKSEWDNISNGISGDFGLGVFFFGTTDLRVKSVQPESPAGIAGIHRGWRITKINGDANLSSANTAFVSTNVFSSNQTTFTFEKPGGEIADITLNSSTYNEHPVMLDTVFSINSSKIGYLVFDSFLGDTNEINTQFQRVFNHFVSEHINDVIVDLRYNGGGYVSIQQKLANYLAPSSANGQLMMRQNFNDKHSSYNTALNFNKAGGLNLPRVVFIVSKGTASASELLINNLKPYLTVKLIGPQPTHGKPVGFFATPVGDWYIFPVSFRSSNKNGEGNYYNGLPLNSLAADGLDKDWGDTTEPCLADALLYLTIGAFATGSDLNPRPALQQAVINSNEALDRFSFKGTVDGRR